MSYLIPSWPLPPNVKSVISTKHTLPLFEGKSNKDPSYRHQLMQALSLPQEPIWLSQNHSNKTVLAIPKHRNIEADASVAHEPLHIAIVFTADCLPILLCNRRGDKVAAIHAGWRGLLHGIIANTIDMMQEAPENILVYLGPAIGPTQFEVGSDVYHAFIARHHDDKKAFTVRNNQKWLANIYMLATIQLRAQGVLSHQIFGGNHCTVSEHELFYSYRRDHGAQGRMASLIWFE